MGSKFNEVGAMFMLRRKELGLTQQECGERVGVSKSEISKIENGRGITFATIEKLSEALSVTAEVDLKPKADMSSNIIHYIVMSLGQFSRKHNLTRREACNYLYRYKGMRFAIDNYEVEHQLSLSDCVDDMEAICIRNGGEVR